MYTIRKRFLNRLDLLPYVFNLYLSLSLYLSYHIIYGLFGKIYLFCLLKSTFLRFCSRGLRIRFIRTFWWFIQWIASIIRIILLHWVWWRFAIWSSILYYERLSKNRIVEIWDWYDAWVLACTWAQTQSRISLTFDIIRRTLLAKIFIE